MMRNDSENSNLKTQYKQQHTVELVVLGPVPDTDRPGRALSTEWSVASARAYSGSVRSDGHAGFKLTSAPPAGPAPTRLTESP